MLTWLFTLLSQLGKFELDMLVISHYKAHPIVLRSSQL